MRRSGHGNAGSRRNPDTAVTLVRMTTHLKRSVNGARDGPRLQGFAAQEMKTPLAPFRVWGETRRSQ